MNRIATSLLNQSHRVGMTFLVVLMLVPCFASSVAQGQCTLESGFAIDHDPGKSDWFECRDLVTFNAGDGTKLYSAHAVGGEHLRAWADGRWTNIPGAPSLITALYVWNGDMYIGTAGQLWKWDGVTFTMLATFAHTSATPIVYAMHVFDLEPNPSSPDGSSVLAVGGNFTSVNGLTTDSLAFWDGSSWWNASNVRNPVYALESDVTGPLGVGEVAYINIGGATGVDRMFSNDPTRAAFAFNSQPGQVRAMAVLDGFLCSGGDFGASVPQLGFLVPGTVNDMMVWDDGSGEKLYLAGSFPSYMSNLDFRGVLVVDAAGTLYPLGQGTGINTGGERINAMALHKESPAHGVSMYFGGDFEYNDGINTYYDFFRLGCVVPEPTVVNGEWELTNTFHLADANAAHYSAFEDALYVGRRNSTYGPKGLYRLGMDDSLTSIWTGDDLAGVEIDANGNIYTSDDVSGEVYRVDFGSTSRSVWVSGWHSGDDDPIGLAIAPSTASGWFSPGDAFMVDRGSGGLDEIWMWSTLSPESETVLHADNGVLENPIDITCSDAQLWICDNEGSNPGTVYEVLSNGSVSLINLSETVESPASIAYVPDMHSLFVLDDAGGGGLARIISIDPQTGSVATIITGFSFSGGTTYAGLDITDDGQRMYVTDGAAGRVYEFTSTTPCPPGDANGDQVVTLADFSLIRGDFGCDQPGTCDCVGDVDGNCQTTLADIGVMLRNRDQECPGGLADGTPSLDVMVNVYETPWPETPPDGGVYYTIDLKVMSKTKDEWTAAEATASILGDGSFWDDPSGSDVPQGTDWFVPGLMNLEYDSYYQATPNFVEPVFILPTPVNQPQVRYAAWADIPDGDNAGPYTIARYTIRLDDDEAGELLLVGMNSGTPYCEISGVMTTREGGGSLLPFSVSVYSTPDCVADLTGDGTVGLADLFAFSGAVLNGTGEGDVDGDGDTDRDDVAIFAAEFLCPNVPNVVGGPVSYATASVPNVSGNGDLITPTFNGGVTHFTMDVQIELGDDYWTSSEILCNLTEPGYTIFQHERPIAPDPNQAPTSSEVSSFSAAAFDTFLTQPGYVVDPNESLIYADFLTSTATQFATTWFAINAYVDAEGTIARFTVVSPEPVEDIALVPAGTAAPDQIVIGTIIGDSTVASTLTTRYPFAFDIVQTPLLERGACCVPVSGFCFNNQTIDECAVIDGVFLGTGSVCDMGFQCAPPCPGDLVDSKTFLPPPDGIVDGADLAILLGEWGVNPGSFADLVTSATFEPPPDGIVDGADLAILLGAWGACD